MAFTFTEDENNEIRFSLRSTLTTDDVTDAQIASDTIAGESCDAVMTAVLTDRKGVINDGNVLPALATFESTNLQGRADLIARFRRAVKYRAIAALASSIREVLQQRAGGIDHDYNTVSWTRTVAHWEQKSDEQIERIKRVLFPKSTYTLLVGTGI